MLQTGREPVLGFQETRPEVAITARTAVPNTGSHASTDALEPPKHPTQQPDPIKQASDQRSEAPSPVVPSGEGPSARTADVQEDKGGSDRNFLAGREFCVFTREAEVELDAQ
jgi:hypothetical protein